MQKVTMNLTKRDIANTEAIATATEARSKAHAVSIALSLTRFIIQSLSVPGTELLLRTHDNKLQRVVMPELGHIAAPESALSPN